MLSEEWEIKSLGDSQALSTALVAILYPIAKQEIAKP